MLSRLEPDLFTPIESIEFRLEALEEECAEAKVTQRRVISQVGANTRNIEKMRQQLALFR